MHSLTPATPPTSLFLFSLSLYLSALRTRGRRLCCGRPRCTAAAVLVQVQWNQANIPSSFARPLSLTWKYSTHSPAFKVRSHTPARTMTHADYHHHRHRHRRYHHHPSPQPPPSPRHPPASASGVGYSLARSLASCISTSVIELRFFAAERRRRDAGSTAMRLSSIPGDVGRDRWDRILVNEFRRDEVEGGGGGGGGKAFPHPLPFRMIPSSLDGDRRGGKVRGGGFECWEVRVLLLYVRVFWSDREWSILVRVRDY